MPECVISKHRPCAHAFVDRPGSDPLFKPALPGWFQKEFDPIRPLAPVGKNLAGLMQKNLQSAVPQDLLHSPHGDVKRSSQLRVCVGDNRVERSRIPKFDKTM